MYYKINEMENMNANLILCKYGKYTLNSSLFPLLASSSSLVDVDVDNPGWALSKTKAIRLPRDIFISSDPGKKKLQFKPSWGEVEKRDAEICEGGKEAIEETKGGITIKGKLCSIFRHWTENSFEISGLLFFEPLILI